MYIETAPHFLSAKPRGMTNTGDPRTTGTDPAVQKRTCRSYGAFVGFRSKRTINMSLLTELFHAGCLDPCAGQDGFMTHKEARK